MAAQVGRRARRRHGQRNRGAPRRAAPRRRAAGRRGPRLDADLHRARQRHSLRRRAARSSSTRTPRLADGRGDRRSTSSSRRAGSAARCSAIGRPAGASPRFCRCTSSATRSTWIRSSRRPGGTAFPVVEDATESLGAEYRGRPVGHLGDIACFSFNGNKIITTGGGGMIVTDNERWIAPRALSHDAGEGRPGRVRAHGGRIQLPADQPPGRDGRRADGAARRVTSPRSGGSRSSTPRGSGTCRDSCPSVRRRGRHLPSGCRRSAWIRTRTGWTRAR